MLCKKMIARSIHAALVVVMALAVCGCTGIPGTAKPVAVSPLREGDLDVKLARVKLREATLQEMVGEIRGQWSKALSGTAVPAILIVESSQLSELDYKRTVTCDLAQIPVRRFLEYIPLMLSGYRVEIGPEAIVLQGPPPYLVEETEAQHVGGANSGSAAAPPE
jgi:hypothetical protein